MCAKYNHLHSGYDYIIVFIGEQENRAGIYDVKLIIHRSCIDLSQILCVKIVFARHCGSDTHSQCAFIVI